MAIVGHSRLVRNFIILKTTKLLPFEVWGGITRSGYALEFKRLSSAYAELGKLYRDHERGRTIPIGGRAGRRSEDQPVCVVGARISQG